MQFPAASQCLPPYCPRGSGSRLRETLEVAVVIRWSRAGEGSGGPRPWAPSSGPS